MESWVYEITCLLCGTEVGELRSGRFRHHAGCSRIPAVRAGSLRCCRCGGSLYMERADALSAALLSRAAAQETVELLAS
jgi:hypothetical protein